MKNWEAFAASARAHIDNERPGACAFALLHRGEAVAGHSYSVGRPVTRETLFQVASISKWVTAWGVMALVDRGRLSLDAPVSRHLTRWALPPSEFDNDEVTFRRLLSHTAGLCDGLGYGGFEPGAVPQTLEQSLTEPADGDHPAKSGVKVGAKPGSRWRYSGGGYTLLQLIVEEVTGQSFADFMAETVLGPLGMAQSTFVAPDDDDARLAEFFDEHRNPAPHYRFTASAAAGLYTSTADLARFLCAHAGKSGAGLLNSDSLAEMLSPQAHRFIVPVWGLGPSLTASRSSGGFIVGHHGFNRPSINTSAHVDPETGDGIIVLSSGHGSIASDMADGWIHWLTTG